MRIWAKKLVRLAAALGPACRGGVIESRATPGEGDDAILQETEYSAPVQLPLDELEFVYLALGLAVGRSRGDRGAHRGFAVGGAIRERGDPCRLGARGPGIKFRQRLSYVHGLEIQGAPGLLSPSGGNCRRAGSPRRALFALRAIARNSNRHRRSSKG